jgi:hypothetical protein
MTVTAIRLVVLPICDYKEVSMTSHNRHLLNVFKAELEFLEKGGSHYPVRGETLESLCQSRTPEETESVLAERLKAEIAQLVRTRVESGASGRPQARMHAGFGKSN